MAPARPLLLLFFVTGFSSLANEVLYLKYVEASIGSPLTSVSVVLMAFFAGTVGGNLLSARLLSRLSPKGLLAGLLIGEAVLVTFALILVPVVHLGREGLLLFYAVDQSAALRSVLISVIGLLMLLLPCVALGIRGPIISAWLSRIPGTSMGIAWGASLLGCCLGVVVVSFVLLENFSLTRSAVLVNGVCGVLTALLYFLSPRHSGPVEETKAPVSPVPVAVLLFFFATGILVIAYQTVWTRYLVGFVPHVRFVFSAIAVSILLGMGAGSFLASRSRNPRESLVWATTLFLVSFTLLLVLQTWFPVLNRSITSTSLPRFALETLWRTALITTLPSVFLGMMFPLGYRAFAPAGDPGHRRYAPATFAANTLGNMAGALLGGFVLLELMGTRGALLSIPVATAAVLLALVWRRGERTALKGLVTGATLVMLALSPLLFHEEKRQNGYALVQRLSASDADTEVLEGLEDDQVVKVLVQNRGVLAGGSSFHTVRKQRSEALLPGLLAPGRTRALVIGFGTGTTAGAVADLGFTPIHCVEISKSAPRLAGFFEDVNGGILKRPDFRLTIDDGTLFVKKTKESYDLVLADAVPFQSPGSFALYNRETFEQYRRILRPGGLVIQWLNLKGMPPDRFEIIARTFASVFSNGWVLYGDPDGRPLHIGLLSFAQGDGFSWPAMNGRYGEHRHLWDPWHLDPAMALTYLVCPLGSIRESLGRGPLATVDNPVLERHFMDGDFSATNEQLLTAWYGRGNDAVLSLVDSKSRPALERRRRLFIRTRDLFALSKVEHQGSTLDKLESAMAAEGIAPERLREFFPALSHLQGELLFSQALSHYRTNQSGSGEALMTAAMRTVYRSSRYYRQNGDRSGTLGDLATGEKYLTETLRLEPSNVKALLNLAQIHLMQSRRDEAVARMDGAVLASRGDGGVLGNALILYAQAERVDRIRSTLPRYLKLRRAEPVILERLLKYVAARKEKDLVLAIERKLKSLREQDTLPMPDEEPSPPP